MRRLDTAGTLAILIPAVDHIHDRASQLQADHLDFVLPKSGGTLTNSLPAPLSGPMTSQLSCVAGCEPIRFERLCGAAPVKLRYSHLGIRAQRLIVIQHRMGTVLLCDNGESTEPRYAC